jgi:hypothetical protein
MLQLVRAGSRVLHHLPHRAAQRIFIDHGPFVVDKMLSRLKLLHQTHSMLNKSVGWVSAYGDGDGDGGDDNDDVIACSWSIP